MDFERTSRLVAPADLVWAAVLRTDTFSYVAGPLLRYPAAELAETRWMPDLVQEDRLLLLGFIPLGRHRIRIASVDEDARRLRTEEGSRLLRRWEHEIVVEAIDAASCRYTDRLEIDAGALTPVVAILARLLFRYRHHRWSRLAKGSSSG